MERDRVMKRLTIAFAISCALLLPVMMPVSISVAVSQPIGQQQQEPTGKEPPPPLRPVLISPHAEPTPTPAPGEEVEGGIIRVTTNLVPLNVRVIDRNNRPIGDVRKEDFRVYEDGVQQPIELFSTEEVPISYGLALDNSGSMRSQMEKVVEAAKTIINGNKPGDETFLARFISTDKVETVQDFTSDKEQLMDAMDKMYVEGGQTAVIDAVYLTAERIAEYRKGNPDDRRRRALIVVTDGEDRASYYKQNQLLDRLREEDVQIYVIGFVNELDRERGLIHKSPRQKAVDLINKMAKETGGRAFFPQSLGDLHGIALEITRDLRTQYVISYNPTNKAHDGTYRAVRVAVVDKDRDKRIALTRSGYIASREHNAGNKPARTDPQAKP
jgi:Ca-activated chloride channel family protein